MGLRIFRGPVRSILLLLTIFLAAYHFRSSLRNAWIIARLPLVWNNDSSQFLLSKANDNFDVTFASYNETKDTATPEYEDLVPPVLHHIALGRKRLRPSWLDARDECLHLHPGWEAHLWTDDKAEGFVAENFPDFKETWDNYRYPVQRMDALRYMVLYVYGGAVMDMDLKCKRSLGPLRRFGFVAPAAHPTGFSIGMMMASARHPFVKELVRNLEVFNQNWLGLPYPTVMFSTGCHFASAIHTLQEDRASLKILQGPADNIRMHTLNGNVTTPLFHHLGSSSWHSYDAALVVSLGKPRVLGRILLIGFVLGVIFTFVISRRCKKPNQLTSVGDSLRSRIRQGYRSLGWTGSFNGKDELLLDLVNAKDRDSRMV